MLAPWCETLTAATRLDHTTGVQFRAATGPFSRHRVHGGAPTQRTLAAAQAVQEGVRLRLGRDLSAPTAEGADEDAALSCSSAPFSLTLSLC